MYRYLNNDWQKAIQYLKRALEVSQEIDRSIPSFPKEIVGKEIVNFYLGTSAYNLDLYESSLKFFDRAIEINPDSDVVWNRRGVALSKLGKYQQEIFSYDKALKINPNNTEANENRNLALKKLSKVK